jgi:hypothetical protein
MFLPSCVSGGGIRSYDRISLSPEQIGRELWVGLRKLALYLHEAGHMDFEVCIRPLKCPYQVRDLPAGSAGRGNKRQQTQIELKEK